MPRPQNEYELFFGLQLTEEQEQYVDSIFDNQITFVDSVAGTGKTTLAVAAASIYRHMMSKQKKNIELLYLFSPVEEDKMGFRKGGQTQKEKAYWQPLVDALEKINENPMQSIYDDENIDNFKNGNSWVRAQSHVFMRGTNQPDKVIIIDEAQNWTPKELKKVLTRVHDSSKVIVIGHRGQIDLKNPSHSGFERYMKWFSTESYCGVANLTKNFRGRLSTHADNFKE